MSAEAQAGWRSQVPGLGRTVHGRPLVYLDYAATAQRPRAVIEAQARVYTELNANVDRGVHQVGADASRAYAHARAVVARHLGAPASEVVFTAGTTDGLNMAAACIARDLKLGPDDRVLVSLLDHHSNLVPWQLVASRTGARVEPIPLTEALRIDEGAFERLLDAGSVRVVALPLVSNVTGARSPVEALAARARAAGALVVVDAAQAAGHGPLDVLGLGADVLAFGAHKAFGPMGIGALWARAALLDRWEPWRAGGGMVERVSFAGTTFRGGPTRFEAGTPNVAGAVGMAAGLTWLEQIGWSAIADRERELCARCGPALDDVAGLRRLARAPDVPIFAFTMDAIHAHDVGSVLDQEGIAVRSGRHCTDPLHTHLGLEGTTRASMSFLTTDAEVDALLDGLRRVLEVLGG